MFSTGIERLDSLAWHLLRASWQGAALAAVVLVVSFAAGRRLDPRFRFLLWLVVVARLARADRSGRSLEFVRPGNAQRSRGDRAGRANRHGCRWRGGAASAGSRRDRPCR